MTYYEELGLDPGATNDEIKRAYKRLTRLLHPDQQQDPDLRELAERQMRRLNNIQEILCDPAKRAAYDQTLAVPPSVLRAAPPLGSTIHVRVTSSVADWIISGGFIRSGWTWVLILVCSIVIAAAWFPSDIPQPDADSRQPLSTSSATPKPLPQAVTPPNSAPLPPSLSTAVPTPGAMTTARSVTQSSRLERQPMNTAASVPENRTALSVLVPSKTPPATLTDSGSSAVTKPADRSPAPQPRSEQSVPKLSQGPATPLPPANGTSLAGSWLYSRNPDDKIDPAHYPADYIELRITDEGGKVRGLYKATYLVLDRPISPRVSFLFEGDPRSAEFLWRGNGGAEGKIRLTRTSTHSMEINWFATQMGTELGLGSGSATLYRRQGY